MLHRSTSSRRRRTSRSAANSPQGNPTLVSPAARGRRASVAVERPTALASLSNNANPQERSSRSSIVPDIALDDDVACGRIEDVRCEDNEVPQAFVALGLQGACQRMLPEIELENSLRISLQPDQHRSPRNSLIPDDHCRSPRGSLIPETNRSPRNSLTPDTNRSPRNSLIPDTVSRSPRHSLVPDAAIALSPRNSLVPDAAGTYNCRSPRGSLVPDTGRGQRSPVTSVAAGNARNSLMPEMNGPCNRSPRHSIVSENLTSPRGSVANVEYDRSPRGSVCPEITRLPRGGGIAPPSDVNRSPRGSIVPESINRSPRGSIVPDVGSRSPRGSICPELNRSPRGSIIGGHELNRSPRGSIIAVGEMDRNQKVSGDGETRSPRGSIGPYDMDRSPRASLTSTQDRRSPRGSLTFQEPRRASADQGSSRNRSTSPYRQREREVGASGGTRNPGNYGAQVNLGYGTNAWADSRRASSSVSQFSGDESRRLCAGVATFAEKSATGTGTLTVATYGSLAFQLKDAHLEASGTCDFVRRALRVVSKTLVVTVCLACLSAMPLLMLIMGLQFIRDCPREPHIPVYMVVGGTLGGVRMTWALYGQIRSRRPDVLNVPGTRSHMSPTRLASLVLSGFLAAWFVLGNFWILNIRWPDYAPTLFEPNRWCHKTLYIFSLVHLCIVYVTISVSILAAVVLAVCRIFGCPWPDRYK